MSRPIKQLAEEALAIQNACNPLGLTKGFSGAIQDLADNLRATNQPSDTRAICRHPILRLWASKLHDLAGMGSSDTERYGEAYDACKGLAK
jgi:hypothetical protein